MLPVLQVVSSVSRSGEVSETREQVVPPEESRLELEVETQLVHSMQQKQSKTDEGKHRRQEDSRQRNII